MRTYLGFDELPREPINVGLALGLGGGGGTSEYTLEVFIMDEKKTSITASSVELDPLSTIGNKTKITADCESEPGGCEDDLIIKPGEIKPINFRMDFLNQLPSGIYEFELNVYFSRGGKKLAACVPIRINVIKPEIIRPWNFNNRIPIPSYLEVNLNTGLARSNFKQEILNNPSGYLLVNSYAGVDPANYLVDLQTGNIERVTPLMLINNPSCHLGRLM